MDGIVQLKVTLHGIKPPIWRRILVDMETSFSDLHRILQIAIGWENSHLYEFSVFDYRIGEPYDDFGAEGEDVISSSEISVKEVITELGKKIEYEYDFGDGWIHDILVERTFSRKEIEFCPQCVAGARNCPPEDCGGVGGYYHLLEAIGDPKHPEYKDMKYWLGGSCDFEYFDKEHINKRLRQLSQEL